jgi:hypothetical protein
VVETPSQAGGSPAAPAPNSSGGGRECVLEFTGESVPCFTDSWGWFNNRDSCYYLLRDPQPAASDTVWGGNYPHGAVYTVTCTAPLGGPGTSGGWGWLASPPDGYGAASITPGDLAARAVDQMQLSGAVIGMTPGPGRAGLVGVPVWLWTAVTPVTWGPNSATATVPGCR